MVCGREAGAAGTPPPFCPPRHRSAEARVGVLIKGLRAALSSLLADKVASPAVDIAGHPVVEAILHLLMHNGM